MNKKISLILLLIVSVACTKITSEPVTNQVDDPIIVSTYEIPKISHNLIVNDLKPVINEVKTVHFDESIINTISNYFKFSAVNVPIKLSSYSDNFASVKYGEEPSVIFNILNKKDISYSFIKNLEIEANNETFICKVMYDSNKLNYYQIVINYANKMIKADYDLLNKKFENINQDDLLMLSDQNVYNSIIDTIDNFQRTYNEDILISDKTIEYITQLMSKSYQKNEVYVLNDAVKNKIEADLFQSKLFDLPININYTSNTFLINNTINFYAHILNDKSVEITYSIIVHDKTYFYDKELPVEIKFINGDLYLNVENIEYVFSPYLNKVYINKGITTSNDVELIAVQLYDLVINDYMYLFEKQKDINNLIKKIEASILVTNN